MRNIETYEAMLPAEPCVGTVMLDKDGCVWQRKDELVVPRNDGTSSRKFLAGWYAIKQAEYSSGPWSWAELLVQAGPLKRLT
jgi:hypothetical protein